MLTARRCLKNVILSLSLTAVNCKQMAYIEHQYTHECYKLCIYANFTNQSQLATPEYMVYMKLKQNC